MLKVAVLLFALALCASASLSPQLDAFWGHYSAGCSPWGQAGSNLWAQHYFVILNNGYMSRVTLFVNNPTCQGGFDATYTRFGVLNFDVGAVTNTVGATNFDLGQDFKLIKPITDLGANQLNLLCPGNFFQTGRENMATEINCQAAWLTPFSTCPMHFTIASKQGNNLLLALPSCTAATRPRDFLTALGALNAADPLIIRGLWQTPCHYIPEVNMAFGTELQILPGDFYYSFAIFGYNTQNCDAASMTFKINMGGMMEVFQPSATVPGAYDLEMQRMGHTIFITDPTVLANMNAKANVPECNFLQFQLNTLTDLRNVTCPPLNMTALRTCPTLYEIAGLSGDELHMGSRSHVAGAPCSPALRPTSLNVIGAQQLISFPGGGGNVGAVVVMVLFILGFAIGLGWIIFKHRSNTCGALRALCCGGSANYSETA